MGAEFDEKEGEWTVKIVHGRNIKYRFFIIAVDFVAKRYILDFKVSKNLRTKNATPPSGLLKASMCVASIVLSSELAHPAFKLTGVRTNCFRRQGVSAHP